MKKGEEVKIKIEYDLFGYETKGKVGIYVSTSSSTGKLLIYFPEKEEWGEFSEDQVSRINPGKIKKRNSKFISLVRKL